MSLESRNQLFPGNILFTLYYFNFQLVTVGSQGCKNRKKEREKERKKKREKKEDLGMQNAGMKKKHNKTHIH